MTGRRQRPGSERPAPASVSTGAKNGRTSSIASVGCRHQLPHEAAAYREKAEALRAKYGP